MDVVVSLKWLPLDIHHSLITLDRNDNWEMGLKFERMEGSIFFFLMRGCTTACLKTAGT